jgi:hypothetical protein
VLIAFVVVVLLGVGVALLVTHVFRDTTPQCSVAGAANSGGFTLAPEQAGNAATIAAVGIKLGMPDHAVTVALATALQESKLENLTSGDRDSAGLFQQRPSQGWGTYAQVTDPVYAATAFYDRLKSEPDWTNLSVTQAAQLVQHSGAPEAYAQWENEARALASALTGETTGTFTCKNLTIAAPAANVLTTTAADEFGTSTVTGAQNSARGWSISNWLVAHATLFGVDQVTYNGQTWTAKSGAWATSGPADGRLSLHQAS